MLNVRYAKVVLLAALVLGLFTVCRRAGPEVLSADERVQTDVTFNAVIQPILSENCYPCHGPDSSSRKGGLRLDRPEFALKGGESGKPAIVAGDPESSQLMRRILSKDPQEVMPPPAMHNHLEENEIKNLKKWIEQGGVYEEHWAFIAPKRPAEPTVKHRDWPRNPVDHFILARLEKENLAPSPEASREALIRRVTYDLTGLPPTPEETAAFLDDQSSDAYERVVDRLLASPRYGEHRARYWLDVARYGDTHGLHSDPKFSAWPYRDYTIRAFNQNEPFDQFIRENLAGDMLPAANLDQQLASGFIRLGISSGEGGTILQELRVNNQKERVEAFGAAFLGLTTSCASCHDHKFDPFSQKDHYQLAAFFNNLKELPNNQNRAEWPPFIRLPKEKDRAEYDRLLARRAEIQSQLQQRRDQASEHIARWLQSGEHKPKAVSASSLQVRLRFDEQQGASFANSAPGAGSDRIMATGGAPVWGEDTWFWTSLRTETTTRIALPSAGDVEFTEAFAVGAWVKPGYNIARFSPPPKEGVVVARFGREAGGDGRGWEVAFMGEDYGELLSEEAKDKPKDGRIRFRLQGTAGAAVIESEKALLMSNRWNHVLAVSAGTGRAADLALYVDGVKQTVRIVRDDLQGSIRTAAPLLLARRDPDEAPLRETAFQDFRFYRRMLDENEAVRVAWEDRVAEISLRPLAQWSDDELHTVADFYFRQRDAGSLALAAGLPEIEASLAQLTNDGMPAIVSEEASRLAYSDVLERGAYANRKERVRPAVPHFLPQMPANSPRDRRGLAEWTVSAANPLTARVTVNRMWAELFGTGLVETTDNFGIVGERPSHPELLDWLAVEFRESGWDIKRFYRLLVTSATYRQSARIEPALLEKDPKNRLLARSPRFRMDAEMLRDTVLFSSNLLVEQLGGPSVKPYQPTGIWEAGTPNMSNTATYDQDHGASLYRRSLYTFWKRMATMPNMNAFDAPDRDVSCTRRQRTTSPLQALVTLNDVQWLEAARKLGERIVRERKTDDDRLNLLGQILLARHWRAEEKAVLVSLRDKLHATYVSHPDSAKDLLTVGEAPVDPTLPATEVAVWMLLASTVQNLDATLNK